MGHNKLDCPYEALGDGEEQVRSIRKIAQLKDIGAIFTGHHGITDDFARAFANWR